MTRICSLYVSSDCAETPTAFANPAAFAFIRSNAAPRSPTIVWSNVPTCVPLRPLLNQPPFCFHGVDVYPVKPSESKSPTKVVSPNFF
ncbi:hypothetical protein D3C71_1938510 [compost metagenome]